MGSYGDGDKAAQIILEELCKNPIDIEQSIQNASNTIKHRCKENAGATVAIGRIKKEFKSNDKYFYGFSSGDARFVIYSKDGNILFQSNEDSVVADLVKKAQITEDEALYSKKRNGVLSAVTGDNTELQKYEGFPVEKGERIVFMSDGISDNLTSDEIWEAIKDKNPKEAISNVSDITDKRMKNADEIIRETGDRSQKKTYTDGYKSKPKRDNRAFVIMDIN